MKKGLWAAFLLLLLADFGSKRGAIDHIPAVLWNGGYPFGGWGIFQWGEVTFSLNFVTNTGAAWGLFSGHSTLLFFLRMGIVSALIAYLLFFNRTPLPRYPLWLIVTGAIGNAIDYCLYGHVIDFLHFTFWGHSFPLFNLADSYITLGAIAFFFASRTAKVSPSP